MKISRLLLAILLCVAPVSAVQAQTDWPTRPVRFLVPWPAGGLNDIIARSFNDKVSQSLGKTVITDFKAGAAGRIGVTEIAKAKPDGYTIGMGNLGPAHHLPVALQADALQREGRPDPHHHVRGLAAGAGGLGRTRRSRR